MYSGSFSGSELGWICWAVDQEPSQALYAVRTDSPQFSPFSQCRKQKEEALWKETHWEEEPWKTDYRMRREQTREDYGGRGLDVGGGKMGCVAGVRGVGRAG